jgi:hypothetical protein
MQHLSAELPATIADARKCVQTKIDLFDQDNQLEVYVGEWLPEQIITDG